MMAMPLGRFYPGDSLLHRLDGRTKLLCFFALLAATVMTDSPMEFCILSLATAAICVLARLGWKDTLQSLVGMGVFLLVIFLMNLFFFSPEDSWFGWWVFRPSPSGAVQGVRIAIRVVFLSLFGSAMLSTTSPIALTSALESMLCPLRVFRIPIAEIAMIMSVSIQFIPVLIEETESIMCAQTARGAKFDSPRLRDKASSVMPLVIPVFLAAFSRADELAMAMEARGYRGAKYRTRKKRSAFAVRDAVALLLCSALCALQSFS